MESNTLLLLVLVAALVAIGLLLALLLRKPDSRMEHALREERDRVASQLQAQRDDLQAKAAETARLGERIAGLERSDAELAEAKDALRAEQLAAGDLRVQLASRNELLQQAESRLGKAEAELAQLRREFDALRQLHADAVANLSHSERTNSEMKDFLANAQERLSGVFAELAGKTFDERTQKAAQQSKGDLEMLLKPFAEQLSGFRNRVDTLYGEEAKERAALAGKVDELKTLNQGMAERANELTRALRGSSKVRGDWGELMLESVLQGSGLVEGAHYERQKSSNDDEGQRLQPDIVVRLPDDRRIVVDSKVNLVDWQDAMNAASPEEQQEAMRRHAIALRQHVKDLGEKNYPKAVGEGALEITIAFVPIEGALSAALGADMELQSYAFDRRVVFASPNTLMALLRVTERLWTRDKVQRQALEISDTGGKVLDALSAFLADFDGVGKKLEEAGKAFAQARNRLTDSPQSLSNRARRLVELGSKARKALPAELQPEETLRSVARDDDEEPA